MAQVRKLTEKVNELVEKHNYPYGRPTDCECGNAAVLLDSEGSWCQDCYVRRRDESFIAVAEKTTKKE